MSKNTLKARLAKYDKMVAGGSVAGRKVNAVDPAAFHKPGSNKR